MNLEAKKKVLRSFTYGLYVLTAKDGDEVAAGTVNWVTQASFQPPLVAVGLKRDSHLHALVERTGKLALPWPTTRRPSPRTSSSPRFGKGTG